MKSKQIPGLSATRNSYDSLSLTLSLFLGLFGLRLFINVFTGLRLFIGLIIGPTELDGFWFGGDTVVAGAAVGAAALHAAGGGEDAIQGGAAEETCRGQDGECNRLLRSVHTEAVRGDLRRRGSHEALEALEGSHQRRGLRFREYGALHPSELAPERQRRRGRR